jgi:hypothetical protein
MQVVHVVVMAALVAVAVALRRRAQVLQVQVAAVH